MLNVYHWIQSNSSLMEETSSKSMGYFLIIYQITRVLHTSAPGSLVKQLERYCFNPEPHRRRSNLYCHQTQRLIISSLPISDEEVVQRESFGI